MYGVSQLSCKVTFKYFPHFEMLKDTWESFKQFQINLQICDVSKKVFFQQKDPVGFWKHCLGNREPDSFVLGKEFTQQTRLSQSR